MDTVRACIVYSLVPYIGILFLPVGLALGIYTFRSSRNGRQFAGLTAVICGVLGAQLFLWWLLYYVPLLARV